MSAIEKFAALHALPRATDAVDRHRPAAPTSIGSGKSAVHQRRLRALPYAHAARPATRRSLRCATSAVNLYSDLLVHDMGAGLADGVTQGEAGPREFRTAPLWGLGQRIFFLHDGRTSDLIDAIQAHQSNGSEANAVVSNYYRLRDSDKQDLLNFLRSL